MKLVISICSAACFSSLLVSTADGQASESKPDSDLVRKLVEQLRSGDFAVREKATQELSKLDEVPESLRKAALSDIVEVRKRAQAALERINTRAEERAFQAVAGELQKVELDRFVRRLIDDKEFATDANWKFLERVAKTVLERTQQVGGQKIAFPNLNFSELPMADLSREKVSISKKRVLFPENAPRYTSLRDCFILCRGTMPGVTGLDNSLVIVNGDFAGATVIGNSLLIVRGNVGRLNGLEGSILLATGNFIGATSCDHSFLQVNNQGIRFTSSRDSVLVRTAVKTTGPTTSRVIETDKGPLQLLKFSKRKSDAELAWGKPVKGLSLALAPTEEQDRFLVRWKNTDTEWLALKWDRLHMSRGRGVVDDLLGQIVLKGPDGKLALPREYEGPRVGGAGLGTFTVLGPGQTHEEIIDLWNYVEKPKAPGKYELAIDWQPELRGPPTEPGVRAWGGIIQSNTLKFDLPE